MLPSSYSSMEQMNTVAKGLESYKPSDKDAIKDGAQVASSLLNSLALFEQIGSKNLAAADNKDGLPIDGLINATINIAEQYIEFGPIGKTLADAFAKLAAASDVKEVPPPISPETQKASDDLRNVFSGWDGKSVFSQSVGDLDYVGGEHGEMFVHNNATQVDTLITSKGDNATVITKSAEGDVQAYTKQFTVSMKLMPDGQSLMTITTNSEPPASISLRISDDGKSFWVVDPSDSSKVLLTLDDPTKLEKFDFLLKEFIAARGSYSLQNLLADYLLSSDDLHEKFRALFCSAAIDPIELILGDGTSPPIARVNGEDNIPIFFDLLHGQESVYGMGADADFVFSDDPSVATTGFRISLANLSKSMTQLRNGDHDAETINNAVSAALAIAQQFLGSDSLASTAAIGMLMDLYGQLSAINTIPANLALAPVSDAINRIYIAQGKVNLNPDKDRFEVIRDIVKSDHAA